MKSPSLYLFVFALAWLAACSSHPPFTTPVPGHPWKAWSADPAHITELATDDASGNGIDVGQPKIYDDASLRMMLDGIRAKLATMTGLDQGSLISALVNVSGATINQTQFGFQVSPTTPPTVATTNTGATNSTATNQNLPAGNTSLAGSTVTTTQPTTQTVTTTNPPASPIPTMPTSLAFTPPASVAPSSLDVLNQQMQLSYEMANLQLLLEGALSDRFVASQRFVKPKVTLGFPITLTPKPPSRDAVAVVEVEVTVSTALSGEAPAVTALLPQEKTYNVAAMTDRTTSIGGGAVIGAVGLGATLLKGRKTLYLVQDQDTIALPRPADPQEPHTVSFVWEFHPVLGEHFVRSGMKQAFVQLAMPTSSSTPCFGTIRVRTYWRSFDQKTGTTGAVIANSALVSNTVFPIPNIDLTPSVASIDYQDLGDGTVLVSVLGNYLAGTYIQLGPTRYDAGKNLVVEDAGLKFVAPIAAIARWTGQIVARSGQKSQLLNSGAQDVLEPINLQNCAPAPVSLCPQCAPPPPLPQPVGAKDCGKISINAIATPLDQTDTTVRVEVTPEPRFTKDSPVGRSLLIAIGGKVFGLNDAIVKREDSGSGIAITAVVPTALLVADPHVRVFRPFYSRPEKDAKNCWDDRTDLTNFGQDSSTERLVLVSVAGNGDGTYILYGNDLDHATILVPSNGASFAPVDNISQGRIRLLTITKDALGTTKKFVFQKADQQRPLVLDIPDPKATPPKASVDSPVVQNTDKLLLTADNATKITSVMFGKKALKFEPVDDSSIRLLNLKADGVTDEQKSREIKVEYTDGTKVTVKFEVVAARIGVK
ncbi:MAG TPA: hypothetical protein VMB85_07820 [Bryobacteraceae bacterium]|nr:hypothetical protein [Bryobacteraceae bacterium]